MLIEEINRERIAQGLKITEFAKRAGMSRDHLSKVLNGKNRPSADMVEQLAAALGRGVRLAKVDGLAGECHDLIDRMPDSALLELSETLPATLSLHPEIAKLPVLEPAAAVCLPVIKGAEYVQSFGIDDDGF